MDYKFLIFCILSLIVLTTGKNLSAELNLDEPPKIVRRPPNYPIGSDLSEENENKVVIPTYGCHTGWCWTKCSGVLPSQWCWSTKTYSHKYVKCGDDNDCGRNWKCGGTCIL